MGTTYTVSDGKLMLILESAEEGGYIVTSPLDPQLITQAETLEEAFLMAYDARELLIQGRAELARKLLGVQSSSIADSEVHVAIPTATASEGSPASSDFMARGDDDSNLSSLNRPQRRSPLKPPKSPSTEPS